MASSVPPATKEEKLNWEVEKLRREVRNLSHTFLTAIILAIAGAVTAGYNVFHIFTDVSVFQEQEEKLKKEITDLTQERETATTLLSSFKAEVSDLTNNTTLTPEQRWERLQSIGTTLQYAAPDETGHSTLPARVYLQFLNDEKEYADKVVSQLELANYKVKALGVSNTSRARIPVVGYYYEEDETQARQLIKLLQQIGVSKIKPDPVKLQGPARPRHFDVWLPRAGGGDSSE